MCTCFSAPLLLFCLPLRRAGVSLAGQLRRQNNGIIRLITTSFFYIFPSPPIIDILDCKELKMTSTYDLKVVNFVSSLFSISPFSNSFLSPPINHIQILLSFPYLIKTPSFSLYLTSPNPFLSHPIKKHTTNPNSSTVQSLRLLKPCRSRHRWHDGIRRNGRAGVCAEWG